MEKERGSARTTALLIIPNGKLRRYAITAWIIIFSLMSVSFMSAITANQNIIVKQQNALIGLQLDLIDLQEKILENINTVFVESDTGDMMPVNVEVHLEMRHYRNGVLIGYSRHAGVLTTTGKEWIEDQLGDAAVSEGDYIGMSNSTDAPSAAWSILPDETTTGAMGRAQGSYVDDGTGQWNITQPFSPTESNATRLVGLYYSDHPASSLIASDTISPINYENGDTVTLTWTVTAS